MISQNAQIVKTMLGSHGSSLTSSLDLKLADGASISFGGLRLAAPGMKEATDATSWWVLGILAALGVDKWEQVAGQYVRAESETANGPIVRIGHIVKDQWFDLRDVTQKKQRET